MKGSRRIGKGGFDGLIADCEQSDKQGDRKGKRYWPRVINQDAHNQADGRRHQWLTGKPCENCLASTLRGTREAFAFSVTMRG